MQVNGIINMNELKERLIQYAKDKHLNIREETIEKTIKFANS